MKHNNPNAEREHRPHSELRQWYDDKGDSIDEIDAEDEINPDGYPELDNQQML